MKNSPLQLERYFVTELSLTANKEFDPKKEVKLTIKDLVVTPNYLPDANDGRKWQVTLRIQQQPGPEANATYSFALELVGLFRVSDTYAEDKIRWIIETNATSVLYSAAREILRSAMAEGPYLPLLLQTVSFYGPNPSKPTSPPTEDKAKATT